MHLPVLAVSTACLVLAVSGTPVRLPADDPARVPASLAPAATEPPAAVPTIGDLAPDFAWDGPEGRPVRLRDLRAQGHVLLLFSPDEPRLLALERDRDRLLDLRIVPAVVMDRGPGALATLARRLGLHYTLVPDPRRVVASQFDAVDARTGSAVPCWYVLDRWGHVRAFGHGAMPGEGYVRLAASALQLPSPDATLPTTAH